MKFSAVRNGKDFEHPNECAVAFVGSEHKNPQDDRRSKQHSPLIIAFVWM